MTDLVLLFKKIGAWNQIEDFNKVIANEEQKIGANQDSVKKLINQNFCYFGQISAAKQQIFKGREKLSIDRKQFDHIADAVIQLLQPISVNYDVYRRFSTTQKLEANNQHFFEVLRKLENYVLSDVLELEEIQYLSLLLSQAENCLQSKPENELTEYLEKATKLYQHLKEQLMCEVGIMKHVGGEIELDLEKFIKSLTISGTLRQLIAKNNYFPDSHKNSRVSHRTHNETLKILKCHQFESQNLSVLAIASLDRYFQQLREIQLASFVNFNRDAEPIEHLADFYSSLQQPEFIQENVSSRSLITGKSQIVAEMQFPALLNTEGSARVVYGIDQNYILFFESTVSGKLVQQLVKANGLFIKELDTILQGVKELLKFPELRDNLQYTVAVVFRIVESLFFLEGKQLIFGMVQLHAYQTLFRYRELFLELSGPNIKGCQVIYTNCQRAILYALKLRSTQIIRASNLSYFTKPQSFQIEQLDQIGAPLLIKQELMLAPVLSQYSRLTVFQQLVQQLSAIFSTFDVEQNSDVGNEVVVFFTQLFKTFCDSIIVNLINGYNQLGHFHRTPLQYLVNQELNVVENVGYIQIISDLQELNTFVLPAAMLKFCDQFKFEIEENVRSNLKQILRHDLSNVIDILKFSVNRNSADKQYLELEKFIIYLKLPVKSYEKMDAEFPRQLYEMIPLPANSLIFQNLRQYLQQTLHHSTYSLINQYLKKLTPLIQKFLLTLPKKIIIKNKSVETFEELNNILESFVSTKFNQLCISLPDSGKISQSVTSEETSEESSAVVQSMLTQQFLYKRSQLTKYLQQVKLDDDDMSAIEFYLDFAEMANILSELGKVVSDIKNLETKTYIIDQISQRLACEYQNFCQQLTLNEVQTYCYLTAYLFFNQIFTHHTVQITQLNHKYVKSVISDEFNVVGSQKTQKFSWHFINIDNLINLVIYSHFSMGQLVNVLNQ